MRRVTASRRFHRSVGPKYADVPPSCDAAHPTPLADPLRIIQQPLAEDLFNSDTI